jgi:hypothetical protein
VRVPGTGRRYTAAALAYENAALKAELASLLAVAQVSY